jgi:hypothetical protein
VNLGLQAVKDSDPEAIAQKTIYQVRTYKSRTTGDQDTHDDPPYDLGEAAAEVLMDSS